MATSFEEPRVVAPRVPVGVPEIEKHYSTAQRLIESARAIAFKPAGAKRVDRKLTLAEVCKLADIHHSQVYGDDGMPSGDKSGKSRLFTVAEFHEIVNRLGRSPRQRFSVRKAVTWAFANFKGGVGKTSQAVGFAEDSALRAYRTLLVDLDPQGSATSMLGLRPNVDVGDYETLLPHIYGKERVEANWKADRESGQLAADAPNYWSGTLRSAIQPTYWPGLDLLPANLALGYADIMMGIRDKSETGFCWYRVIRDALDTVAADYDNIIMDLPPTLSLYTGSAMYAADAVVIPSPANQMDLESTLAFLKMLNELLVLAEEHSGKKKVYEAFRILVTKYQSNVLGQARLYSWISTAFQNSMVPDPMPLLPVIQDLGPELQTILEHAPRGRDEPRPKPGEPFRASKGQIRAALAEMDLVHRVLFDDLHDIYRARAQAAESASPSVAQTERAA